MKKLFTLMVMALVAMSANAAQLDLSLDNLGSGWSSSYDAATKTITYEGAWTGRGWWVDPADYSAYDNVVVDFETQDLGVQLVIEYNNDVKSTTQWVDAGKTQIIATLDATGKASVKQLYIQSSKAGTVVLKRAYIATSDAVEKEAVKDLVLSTGDNLTLAAGGYGWNCPQSWLAKDVTEYNTMIFEIASIEGGAKTTVQLVPAAGGDSENLEIPFVTSSETKTYALDISAYNTLNQFAYQNTNKGADEDETAIKESKIVVTKVYLTAKARSEFPENPTAESGETAKPVMISWGADDVAAAGKAKSSYGTGDFTMSITDTDGKVAVDANDCYFGDATTQTKFTHRLKSGGKSGSKLSFSLAIPSDGTLKVYARTGSNSATDRTLVLTQGGSELYNQIVKEADAVKVAGLDDKDPSAEKNVYPIISVSAKKGDVVVTFPVGSMNFYGFEFVSGTSGIQQTIAPAKVIENNVIYNLAGQKVNENYKGIVIKNGKKYIQK